MSVQPINIFPSSKSQLSMQQNNATYFGTGHPGVDMLDRIMMGLKSGINSEIEWSINCLYQQSFMAPGPIDLEKNEFLGRKIIEYFNAPFKALKNGQDISNESMILSANCALAIRNLIQDLTNQQWCSQIYEFKQDLVEILEFLINWFYNEKSTSLLPFNDQFMEIFYHLIDILDTLTCYYINNSKDDKLFNQLLKLSTKLNDKYLIIGTLSCLTHLLFTKAEEKENESIGISLTASDASNQELVPIYDNCIDKFTSDHLEHYLNYLLINDSKLNVTVLEFLKQYLSSGASIKSKTVKESKSIRLQELLQLKTTKANLHTIFKTLPSFVIENVGLNDPNDLSSEIHEELINRTKYSSVPSQPPMLSEDLYSIISRFKEPLRSTTWLRCCYEPIFNDNYDNENNSIGEVTQISLWKAYEKQFEKVWKNKSKDDAELLQAVDFIKNVNNAFPNSEAMVVILNESDPTKKKFIIRGIQPRQFVVSIDHGNYDALKKKKTLNNFNSGNSDLPIGTVNASNFQDKLNVFTERITQLTDIKLNKINLAAKDSLDLIIEEIEASGNLELMDIFKLYNQHWLLEVIYSNPILLEKEIVDFKWLKYLL